jgi:inner membrane protein
MVFWHWLVLAAIFAVIEIAAPAMVCLWLAGAAAGVGVIVALAPDLAWEYQALLFAVLAIAGVALGRAALRRERPIAGNQHLNRRAESYVGRTFVLEAAIVEGRGRIKVDDSVWRIEGPDLPAGTRVRVTGADNTLLRVEAA